MHGKIFQITTVKVDENCRLTENTIEQGAARITIIVRRLTMRNGWNVFPIW